MVNNQCHNCIYRDKLYVNRCTKGMCEFYMIGVACPEYTVNVYTKGNSTEEVTGLRMYAPEEMYDYSF